MPGIYHCLGIEASIQRVREAVADASGLSKWWTKGVEGGTEIGDTLTFRFSSGAFNRQKIVTLEPDRVEWECIDGHEEWIGTKIAFELRQDGDRVKLCFSHDGWRRRTEYLGECSFHWAHYLRSLREYCEDGRGFPNEGLKSPRDS